MKRRPKWDTNKEKIKMDTNGTQIKRGSKSDTNEKKTKMRHK